MFPWCESQRWTSVPNRRSVQHLALCCESEQTLERSFQWVVTALRAGELSEKYNYEEKDTWGHCFCILSRPPVSHSPFGISPLLLLVRPNTPTTHYSYDPLLLRPITPTAHYSYGPILRNLVILIDGLISWCGVCPLSRGGGTLSKKLHMCHWPLKFEKLTNRGGQNSIFL